MWSCPYPSTAEVKWRWICSAPRPGWSSSWTATSIWRTPTRTGGTAGRMRCFSSTDILFCDSLRKMWANTLTVFWTRSWRPWSIAIRIEAAESPEGRAGRVERQVASAPHNATSWKLMRNLQTECRVRFRSDLVCSLFQGVSQSVHREIRGHVSDLPERLRPAREPFRLLRFNSSTFPRFDLRLRQRDWFVPRRERDRLIRVPRTSVAIDVKRARQQFDFVTEEIKCHRAGQISQVFEFHFAERNGFLRKVKNDCARRVGRRFAGENYFQVCDVQRRLTDNDGRRGGRLGG